MNSNKIIARIVGILFIIGTVAGISTLKANSILSGPDYLLNISANENQIIIGAAFILIMGFALSMMSVVLFPVLKKYNETLAFGAIIFRGVFEGIIYIAIALNWLLQVTVSREFVKAGALEASYFQTFGTLLQGVDYWSNHMLSIVFALGALMIYYLFYKSKLIPRWLSGWGFVGAILYFIAPLLNVFDPQLPSLSIDIGWGRLMWPLAIQEMVFAVWLIVKGFSPSTLTPASSKK